jgi:hypothetical protein
MLRKLVWSVAFACLLAAPALAQSVWTGAVSDDWSNAANWTNGVPSNSANLRARIQSNTDLVNWPVIKTGANINQGGRIQAPFDHPGPDGDTRYSRLTIESGATLTVGDDFLFGENSGTALRPIVGSLDVAGSVSVAERMRFGHNEFMTLDVNVTGSMTQTVSDLDFRIATGDDSNVNFGISGSGVVSVGGEFEMGSGGLLSLSDDGKLVLNEYVFEDEDDLGNPIFIPVTKADLIDLIAGYVDDGLIQGLPDYYSGPQPLTWLGYHVGYYEEATSVHFVSAVPEPASGFILLSVGTMSLAVMRRRQP